MVGIIPHIYRGDKFTNDDYKKQTDTVLIQLAKAMESKGLSNPARWTCNFRW